jgi:hypothetical protein
MIKFTKNITKKVQSRTIHASAPLIYRPSAEAMSSDCLFFIYQRQEKINKKENIKIMQRLKTSTKPSYDQNINK